MFKKLALASAFVLYMTILGGTAWADNITIVNPSFETPAGPFSNTCGTGCSFSIGSFTGWTTLNGGEFQPGSLFFTSPIPDGTQIGYTNATRSLSQTLTGNSVLANSIYTLSVFVGNRTDGDSGSYTLSLDTIVGGVTTTLCNFSGNANGLPGTPGSVALGTFQLEGCSYTSGSTVPSGDLYLLFTANSGQLDVDSVSLIVQSATATVPEPSSVLLLSVGMLLAAVAFMARRRKELQLTA